MATAAPKIKTKFIEKTHEKVWNITDHPATDVKVQTVMVAGKAVLPGMAIKVPLEVMKDAKKIKALVDAKMIHIGPTPPTDYQAAKGELRAVMPKGSSRSHGERVVGGAAAAAKAPLPAGLKELPTEEPKKVAVELSDTVTVNEKVEVKEEKKGNGNGGRHRR